MREQMAFLTLVAGLTIVAMGVVAAGGSSQTFIEDDITTDTTWEAGDGPYRVVNSISVAEDTTLTVEPGARVEFAEGVTFTVTGELTAGSATGERVTFTSPKSSPEAGAWEGIQVTGAVEFTNAEIRYADEAFRLGGEATFAGVTVANVSSSALEFADRPTVAIRDSTIVGPLTYSGDGAFESLSLTASTVRGPISLGGDSVPTSITMTDSRTTGEVVFGTDVTAGRDLEITIQNNTIGDGLRLRYESISQATVSQNRIDGPLSLSLSWDDYFDKPSTVAVRNNRITGTDRSGSGIGLSSEPEDQLTIEGNEIRRFKHGINLASGVRNLVVRDNHIYDNTHGIRSTGLKLDRMQITENSIVSNGGTGVLLGTNRRSTWILEGKQVDITSNIISANQRGVVIRETGYTRINAAGNAITRNQGVGVVVNQDDDSTAHTVTNSVIANNGVGFRAEEETKTSIEGNYWGAENGPYHSSINPSGAGDNVTGQLSSVDLVPFESSRPANVPQIPVVDIQWNSPQLILTDNGDVGGDSFVVMTGGERIESAQRKVELGLDSGTHDIRVFAVTDSGYEGPLTTTTVSSSTPTPTPQPTDVDSSPESDPTQTPEEEPSPTADGEPTPTEEGGIFDGDGETPSSDSTGPGFGVGVALVAILCATVVGRTRR